MSGLSAPARISQGRTERLEESLEHVYMTIKPAITLESGHQKGALQCLIKKKKVCSSQQTTPNAVFSILLWSLSLLMWFLWFLPPCSLLIFTGISLPLSVLETKCPVWCPELKIIDAGFLLPRWNFTPRSLENSPLPPAPSPCGEKQGWPGRQRGKRQGDQAFFEHCRHSLISIWTFGETCFMERFFPSLKKRTTFSKQCCRGVCLRPLS